MTPKYVAPIQPAPVKVTIKPILLTALLRVIFISAGIIMLLFFMIRKTIGLRETQLLHFQERLLKMLDDQKMLTESDKKLILELSSAEGRVKEVITVCPQARQRARRIEIIEKVLDELNSQRNYQFAEEILSHFLNTPNNRVCANAAKALYKYNKQLSLKTISKMIESENKWFRASAAWVLEQFHLLL